MTSPTSSYEFDGWALPRIEAAPRDALMDLMNRHEQALSNYLHVLLGDRDVAMDCAQDTFLRAYQVLQRGGKVNTSWLYKVARNRAMDEFRQRRREQSGDALDAMVAGTETEGTLAVRRVLSQLCPSDREVLYLFAVDKFDTAEIAAMLGVQPGAIRMRLVRARERFRVLYGAKP